MTLRKRRPSIKWNECRQNIIVLGITKNIICIQICIYNKVCTTISMHISTSTYTHLYNNFSIDFLRGWLIFSSFCFSMLYVTLTFVCLARCYKTSSF